MHKGTVNFPFQSKEAKIEFKKFMSYDNYLKKFMPKLCNLSVKNTTAGRIIASTTF